MLDHRAMRVSRTIRMTLNVRSSLCFISGGFQEAPQSFYLRGFVPGTDPGAHAAVHVGHRLIA